MIFLSFLILIFPLTFGYNFLISIPNAEKSESSLVFSLVDGVLNAGHNVTLITAFKYSVEHDSLKVIWIPESLKAYKLYDDSEVDFASDMYLGLEVYEELRTKIFWEDKRSMEIWNERKKYDLFLTLSLFAESSFPFLMDNDIPFVQMATPGIELFPIINDGHVVSPAVIPEMMSNYDEYMTFWERSRNLVLMFKNYFSLKRIAHVYLKSVVERFPDFGNYERYYDRVSLTLFNGHFSLDTPVPLLPNEIEIGTIHCRKALPLHQVDKDIANFVEGSGDAGIIYFSLGTIINFSNFPNETKQMFLEAFRKIPQRVLWKYDEVDLQLPPNVLIRPWMPQQDILGHHKTKVFISHCGTLGSQEAKYHGVPILGLPMWFDQNRNGAKLEKNKQAIVLSWDNLSVDKIVDSLNILVNDTSYRKRMKSISKIVQDQKDSPVERAIWWMEYVIRHKGARHLTFAGKRLSLFQYVMLDVILFWLCAFFLLIFGVVYIFRMICFSKKRGNKDELKPVASKVDQGNKKKKNQ